MQLIRWLFRSEYKHFNQLTSTSKQLLNSIFLHSIVMPIFAIFITAFLWRQTESALLVTLFNLVYFMTTILGFYVNGLLLRKFYPSQLLFVGVCLKALGVFWLIILPVINPTTITLMGIFLGLSASLYWANRSLLVLKATHSKTRIYFTSLDQISMTIMGIVIPILIGTFIIYGKTAHLYTPLQAYYIIGILTLIISFLSGYTLRNLSVGFPLASQVILKNPSKKWVHSRYFMIIFGLLNGIMAFIPPLMILSFMGKEDTLGTIQSLTAIAAAVVMYGVARSLGPHHRMKLLGVGIALAVLGSLAFLFIPSSIGVLLFVAFQAIAQPLLWVAYSSLLFDVIETENGTDIKDYSYMFDSELYMNAGRVSGILLFFFFVHAFSATFALQYIPFLFSAAQIILIFIAHPIDRKQKIELAILPQTV